MHDTTQRRAVSDRDLQAGGQESGHHDANCLPRSASRTAQREDPASATGYRTPAHTGWRRGGKRVNDSSTTSTPPTPTTYQVVFRPARNGSGVICRLPSGKIAFPSRYFWRDAAPQAYEIWEVAECGGYSSVAYVKPLRRLAEAPLGQSKSAQMATEGLIGIAACASAVIRLFQQPRHARRPDRREASA